MTKVALDTLATAAREILFVDAGVPDADTLLAGLCPDVEAVRLEAGRSGFAQITEALAGRRGIAALHVLGHGSAGAMSLGDDSLTAAGLDARAAEVAHWRAALAEGADILLYGCSTGAGPAGRALIDRLAALTGADVAASTDETGAPALGGNWALEARVGAIEAGLPFSADAVGAWRHTLNHFRYGTMSWEWVPEAPNTVLIKGSVDWTNTHGHIPTSVPVGGIAPRTQSLDFSDGTNAIAGLRVVSRDTATNDVLTEFVSDLDGDGTIEAGEVGVRHTLTGSGPFTFSWGSSAREDAINLDSDAWRQAAGGDLSFAGNNSPVVATPAVVQLADNKVFTYRISATDPDGDALRFRYGTQAEFFGTGAEATRPAGLTLSPDGLITWDISDAAVATVPGDRWQVTVVAEDLDANGAVKSSTPVDFVLRVASATAQAPVFEEIPTTDLSVRAGQTADVHVVMDDPDSADAPTITVLNPPSTDPAVFSTTSVTDASGKTTLHINFTPTEAMKGAAYVLNVRGRDAEGMTNDQSITMRVPAGASVTSVAAPESGTFGVGDGMDFTVNFGDAVAVNTAGGTPRLAVDVGGSTRYAAYVSGSGTNALVFRHTVQAGDRDADGVAVSALELNGGSLKDSYGDDVALPLRSVASTASVLVDGIAPAVNPNIGVRLSGTATDRPLVELKGAVSDASTPPGGVVLTLTAAPAHGTLKLGDAALGVGDTFTMADVQAGRVTYTQNSGGAPSDGFEFSASDGASVTAGGRLAIELAPAGGGGNRPEVDVVYGGAGDDAIYAPDTGSRIVAGGGNDTVTGGAGLDDVQYAGFRGDHTITEAAGLPTDVSGPEGTTRVSGVETLSFEDGRVEYAPGSKGHLVERLYQGIFGRSADAEGLSWWTGKLDKGWSPEQVGEGIFRSAEALGLPPASDDAYVEALYDGILERSSDPAGLDAFMEALASGGTRGQVAAAIATSAEAQDVDTAYPTEITDHEMLVAARAYQVVLGRAPDLGGLRFWDREIEALELSDAQVARLFAASGEFESLFGGVSDPGYVEALYQQAFERPGDGQEAAWWVDGLAAGAERDDAAAAFFTADEGWAHRERLAAEGLHVLGAG